MQKGVIVISSKRKQKFMNVYNVLASDEKLLRLLYHDPMSNPTSDKHENILDMESYDRQKIIDRHILTTSKSADMEEFRLCRVYIYLGKTRPSIRNYRVTKQEIIFDLFCHLDYEVDLRLEEVSDRISELMFNNRIKTGLGRVDYRTGYDFDAPRDYIAYRHVYEIGGTK